MPHYLNIVYTKLDNLWLKMMNTLNNLLKRKMNKIVMMADMTIIDCFI